MNLLPTRPLRSLTRREWGALVRAVPVVLLVRAGLSTLKFKDLVDRLRSLSAQFPVGETSEQEIKRIAWAVNAIGARLLGSRPCLTQALALQFLLWRRRVDTELRIGVDKDDDGQLLAHAWVVRDGKVLIGGHLSEMKYRPLPGLQDKVMAQGAGVDDV